jgi:hypothetical protein
MYVIAQHEVRDPRNFWDRAGKEAIALQPNLKLHHCFPNADGSRAVCLWEADSVRSIEEFFADNGLDENSRNTFFVVENREGVALPSLIYKP